MVRFGSDGSEDGCWVFDEQIAKDFEEHVRNHTPFYDEVHRMVVELSKWFISKDGVVCDVGTSTGEAICNMSKSFSELDLTFYAIDPSAAMIRKACARCGHVNHITFVQRPAEEFDFPRCNLVICLYTLQFIPKHKRQGIVDSIYAALVYGGGFILAEKVRVRPSQIDEWFVKHHEEMKRRKGVQEDEIVAKRRSLRGVLEPITVEGNVRMLEKAGFLKWSCFFRWYNFMGIIAIK